MRIAIVCNDSRGGVQPYVALALGLRGADHQVRAVAPGGLAHLFSDVGIDVTPLSGDVQAVVQGSNGAAERGALSSLVFAARHLPHFVEMWMRETLEGCAEADVITGGIGGMGTGLAVAEHLGVPFVETHLQPVGMPTDAYPGGADAVGAPVGGRRCTAAQPSTLRGRVVGIDGGTGAACPSAGARAAPGPRRPS